jgi:hypothetical protein
MRSWRVDAATSSGMHAIQPANAIVLRGTPGDSPYWLTATIMMMAIGHCQVAFNPMLQAHNSYSHNMNCAIA